MEDMCYENFDYMKWTKSLVKTLTITATFSGYYVYTAIRSDCVLCQGKLQFLQISENLFICCLFNNAVSNTDYSVLKEIVS